MVAIGTGCIYVCILIRIAVTVGIAFGDKLNVKEKVISESSYIQSSPPRYKADTVDGILFSYYFMPLYNFLG